MILTLVPQRKGQRFFVGRFLKFVGQFNIMVGHHPAFVGQFSTMVGNYRVRWTLQHYGWKSPRTLDTSVQWLEITAHVGHFSIMVGNPPAFVGNFNTMLDS